MATVLVEAEGKKASGTWMVTWQRGRCMKTLAVPVIHNGKAVDFVIRPAVVDLRLRRLVMVHLCGEPRTDDGSWEARVSLRKTW